MCGIVGVIEAGGNPEAVRVRVTDMLGTIRHRGPDDSGVQVEPQGTGCILGLGHNRLSILDLSARGHQPMVSPCGRYILVYNGEVYNYLEIARELGSDPVLEVSTGDTAVVLAALMRWGTAALSRFNGMWALALYDRAEKKLLLSRDRMGVKPLYLFQDEGVLLFASEIKALLLGSRRRFRVHPPAVARYILQSITDAQPETFFEGIREVPSASYAILNLGQARLAAPVFQPFWRHPFETGALNAQTAVPDAAEVREIFLDAVRVRLRSDVPVGILLSGGVDSSAIVGAAKTAGAIDHLRLLAVVSRDPSSNEEPFIDRMAAHVGARHVNKFTIDLDPLDTLTSLSDACWHNDQPVVSFSAVAHGHLMRMARQIGTTVILTGQGADEQLGGYNKFFYFYLQDLVRRREWRTAAAMVAACVKNGTILGEFRLREAKRYLPFLRRGSSNTRHLGAKLGVDGLLETGLGAGYAEREWRDVRQLSIPMLLHYEDRMSMAMTREMRVPFLDYRLVEMLARVPPSEKLKGGWTKAIFRHAMQGILPPEIQWRRDKKGFTVPEASWMRREFRPAFDKMFHGSMAAADLGLLNQEEARHLYSRFLSRDPRVNHKDVFNVYCLETWLRRFEEHLRP